LLTAGGYAGIIISRRIAMEKTDKEWKDDAITMMDSENKQTKEVIEVMEKDNVMRCVQEMESV
jgi:hypothetical protein